jgi:rhamnose transport system permease protein
MKALRGFSYWQELVLFALLVGLLAWARSVEPLFVTLSTQMELASHMWIIALVALPMLLIIISGGIDLSVGSTLALSAVAMGMCYQRGMPALLAALVAIVTGTALGALNGFFVAKLKVHPLIVTLATLAAFRGVATGVSLARAVSGFDEGYLSLATKPVLGLPLPGFLFLIGMAVVAWTLAKTPFGRTIFAIGHNETAARFSGLNVDRVKLLLYSLAGTAAGLAAAVFVAQRNTAKSDAGGGLELEVITAVVLGGANINGGRGNVVGLFLGVALIHEAKEFVTWRWNSDNLIYMVVGALLVASVLMNRLLSPRGRADD